MSRYVHYNRCKGGHAFEEIDDNVYCLGRTDDFYEDEVYTEECQKCPRLLQNNENKIEEYIQKHKTDSEDKR